jgi:hypothetical protein
MKVEGSPNAFHHPVVLPVAPSYATFIAFNGILCQYVYTHAGDISEYGEMRIERNGWWIGALKSERIRFKEHRMRMATCQ